MNRPSTGVRPQTGAGADRTTLPAGSSALRIAGPVIVLGAAVLAVVAFFFSLIPLVGTLTGSAIIILVCLTPGLGSPLTALVALIWYAVYMQVEAYVLAPRIMNRAVSVPGAVVVIAALAGGALLGLLGALIAIPVAASILIIYRQVLIPRQNLR